MTRRELGPFNDRTITVDGYGQICIERRKINLSTMFAAQTARVAARHQYQCFTTLYSMTRQLELIVS